MKYFKVSAKCGHVGKHHYIVKDFYVAANDGKEAALKVRYSPRVKHDRKDAILSVETITETNYNVGKALQAKDKYFRVHSSTEQRNCGAVDDSLVFPETKEIKYQKCKNSNYYRKRERIIRKDVQQQLGDI